MSSVGNRIYLDDRNELIRSIHDDLIESLPINTEIEALVSNDLQH